MSKTCAARLFKEVQHCQASHAKFEAMAHPELFVQAAANQGYYVSPEELDSQIRKMSLEEISCVINPGIAPRRHLIPR
jgi:hypothetical protein